MSTLLKLSSIARYEVQLPKVIVGSEVREYDSPKSIVSESESEKVKKVKVKK